MIIFIDSQVLIESVEAECDKKNMKPDDVVQARLLEDLERYVRQPTAEELLNGRAD